MYNGVQVGWMDYDIYNLSGQTGRMDSDIWIVRCNYAVCLDV